MANSFHSFALFAPGKTGLFLPQGGGAITAHMAFALILYDLIVSVDCTRLAPPCVLFQSIATHFS